MYVARSACSRAIYLPESMLNYSVVFGIFKRKGKGNLNKFGDVNITTFLFRSSNSFMVECLLIVIPVCILISDKIRNPFITYYIEFICRI